MVAALLVSGALSLLLMRRVSQLYVQNKVIERTPEGRNTRKA